MKRTPPLDHHQLSARQLEFIALGAAVGSGLFIGVGQGIRIAGPGILVAYLIAGLMVFIVARCLGEMALADAPPKVFTTYTERYVGPRSAFVQGWSYWIICVLVCTVDLTAAGLFVRLWLPKLPLWIPELAGLTLVFAVNRLRVRVFGEVEFWISLLKIVGIGAFLLLSVALLMSPTPRLPGSSISNLWTQGGFLPKGLLGVVAALPVALFAFGGSELIGIAAAEAERPERSLPRATNGLLFRLALFYMGTTLALVCLEAWRDVPVDSSPIVDVLRRTGVPAAATMMNAILVSAVLSSCNSTLYAGARVLRVLGEGGAAPKRLSKLNANGVPALASGVTLGAVATAILLGRFLPNGLFGLLMAMAAVIVIANWTLFLVAHLRFQRLRKAEGERRFAAPGAPWSTVAVLVLIVGTMIVALGDSGLRLGALLATGVLLSLALVATLQAPRTSAAGAADVDGVTLPTSRGGRRHDRHGR